MVSKACNFSLLNIIAQKKEITYIRNSKLSHIDPTFGQCNLHRDRNSSEACRPDRTSS